MCVGHLSIRGLIRQCVALCTLE
ncbi:unnamed protein product [Linum tenue]|uniref:Uncharacterized protein n=1 Tax=Linum tenue TaxID=586396 RepID=A0AAV0RQU4_9ROSI|nr:unnamed protein product [Linum tenue]